MQICIIGAGGAGLNAAKHCIANNHKCTVFEQTGEIGGTWVYTDEVGTNKYGIPVHTSMYQGLRTNLPKEVMGFPDYPMPKGEISYLPQQDILNYLQQYAKDFNLTQVIKFYNQVKLVEPIENNRWSVRVRDLKTQIETIYEFDAIMICNGHYFNPRYPDLKGITKFTGIQIHSHDYRKPEQFQDKRVVIIGAGPSGVDLAFHVSSKAKKIILSHHLKETISTQFPEHVVQKPDIVEVTETGVIFKDGSMEEVDAIFYCTGFKYSFPFLSEKCGIFVEDNYVQPLYKHVINIEHPTMALIGLPFYVCAFIMFDLQVRVFLKILSNKALLPSKAKMDEDRQTEVKFRYSLNLTNRQAHMMGPLQNTYYDSLSDLGQIDRIAPVFTLLHNESSRRFLEDLIHFRDDSYEIIDENNFIQTAFGGV